VVIVIIIGSICTPSSIIRIISYYIRKI